MALFNAWCDSSDFSVGNHFLYTITARGADFNLEYRALKNVTEKNLKPVIKRELGSTMSDMQDIVAEQDG
ncbi:hypothetical protein DK672_23050 [Salmonella enterica subsp. enterica serovar Anecho]|uniref:Uncharacterized protein n=1 Tax=Salmonella enterica subsp. enterica serovar Abeokuta TaxID=2926665 RepID=A0A8T9IF24_SALET|nr:hypothetical protein [Salmonella enterica]EBQ9207767.1 hypothetical protein [Salmonella enterica subsp. enterica serovar Anecho]EBR9235511.1 hypothetical protein [Salmonella enterica subsp. enterica serovar Anecho]EBS5061912.1 hypothetical protein [Salmonella enterica subsp. enterica serovar Anecho]EBU0151396.1 hypothetical protein [Salmonella enterica]EBZ6859740.1 hypothetical protein [Salmonella enterica subsp. enterica serovar Anecho]